MKIAKAKTLSIMTSGTPEIGTLVQPSAMLKIKAYSGL